MVIEVAGAASQIQRRRLVALPITLARQADQGQVRAEGTKRYVPPFEPLAKTSSRERIRAERSTPTPHPHAHPPAPPRHSRRARR